MSIALIQAATEAFRPQPILAAEFTVGSKTRPAVLEINVIDPARGSRTPSSRHEVSGKREARAIAAKLGATPMTTPTAVANATVRPKLHKAPVGECAYCDRERAGNNSFHPSHDASERCESGKHNHCTCDACF